LGELKTPEILVSITSRDLLTLEAEPRKLGLKRQGEGERNMEELEMLLPAER